MEPLFTNDAIVFGLLMILLAGIFYTTSLKSKGWKAFYTYVPALLLCYFLPALLNYPFGLISPEFFEGSALLDFIDKRGIDLTGVDLNSMSFEGIKTFLESKGVDATGYNKCVNTLAYAEPQSFDLDAVKKLLEAREIEVKKLSVDLSSMSFDQTRQFLESQGIESEGYKQFVHKSNLYYMASRYLLPASLILLCLSIDFKGIMSLGPKALIMFFAATLGIVLGGPIALLTVSYVAPNLIPVTPDELWRGLSTVAGSWIGGGANQTAMKEIYEVKDNLFATMIIVDVVVANIWMGFLLYGANISKRVDGWLRADASAIEDLKKRVSDYRAEVEKTPTTTDMFILGGIAFGGVALAHWGSEVIVPFMKQFKEGLTNAGLTSLMSGFFWLIVISTTVGLLLSFSKARRLEGVGASRWGSLFIYVLVATIGMKMNLGEVWKNLGLFAIGILWMLVHVIILLVTAKLIRAPFFFVAVGSQANVGGAASAPIVASAFSPSLAPVGVLMAVLGYALGTYGAIICAYLMQSVVT